jgi:putative ABC transport system ATP-binding protein
MGRYEDIKMPKMIDARSMVKVYKTRDGTIAALNNVCLEVSEGEYVAVMGPSGCGKSTLLNLLGLIDTFDEGSYHFFGEDMGQCSEQRRALIRHEYIGYVFQSGNLIDELSIAENVEMPLFKFGLSEGERKKKTNAALEILGILRQGSCFPHQLSGGEKQRAAVARAVVSRPRLILADEPTGNLDEKHGASVMEILGVLNEQGTTIVMATHQQAYADYGRRIVRLLDGSIVWENI